MDAQYRPIPDFAAFARLALDLDTWERVERRLRQVRERRSPAAFAYAVEVALRIAAFDSPAIEGFYEVTRGVTITVATQAPGWERLLQERGPEAQRLYEGQVNAYHLAADFARSEMPISEAWIRELQRELAAGQDTYRAITAVGWQDVELPKGEYKRHANHVVKADGTIYPYAPVEQTQLEMRRLIEQMRTSEFEAAHSVLQAAYAHYGLVVIHPFADVNGRTARALASTFLLRRHDIPLVIFADQRDEYLEALIAADGGDYQPFVTFVADCGIDAMGFVADQMAPPPQEAVHALRTTLSTQGGLTHAELDNAAADLFQHTIQKVNQAATALGLPSGTSFVLERPGGSPAPTGNEERYRKPLQGDPGLHHVTFRSDPPAGASISIPIRVMVAKDKADRYPFLLERTDTGEGFPIRLRDVHPRISTDFETRLDSWVANLLGEGVERLTVQADEALHKAGYH